MEQQQIKVSFSVGTKLLISVVLLLFLVILFLNISTILLFREDKRAYTYQTQSTEALLAGHQFLSLAKQTTNDLKSMLAYVDPNQPLDANRTSSIQAILNNQNEILSVSFQLVNIHTGEAKTVGQASRESELNTLKLNLKDYEVSTEWMKYLLPDLQKNAFSFLNLSKPGNTPTLTILFADLNLKDHANGMPVAIGLVSLKELGNDLQSLQVTIATKSGWVLFDSDPTVQYAKESISNSPLFRSSIVSKVENGALEYDYNGAHYLGSYFSPGMDVVVLTKVDWRNAMKSTYTLIEKCIMLGAMAVGAAIVFAILFSKTLTAPLGRLYNATKEVAQGNFQLLLEEKGSDEIAALSKSFNLMSKKIEDLIQESIKKVQLENEFAIASTVQQTLIPPQEYRNEWLHIFSHYKPADQCGGDWWGFFGVEKKAVIMIADATGHGLPSALITASARSCFSVMQKWAQEDPDFTFSPSAMLSFANRVVFEASQGNIMMTFFVGVIDQEAGTITYSNAGHNPPWLFKKKEDVGYDLKSLALPGPRLGESREYNSFKEASCDIKPHDLLFLYTDGVTEGKNPNGDMFGKKNLRKTVESNLYGGPIAVVSNLVQEFMKHNGEKALDDDITVAAVVIHGGA